jgi:hypothetical protein
LPPPQAGEFTAARERASEALSFTEAGLPRIATVSPLGKGRALAVNDDGTENSESNPARRGSELALTLRVRGDGRVRVWIGGKPVRIVKSRGDMVKVLLPDDLPAGAAAVNVRVGEKEAQAGTMITVD